MKTEYNTTPQQTRKRHITGCRSKMLSDVVHCFEVVDVSNMKEARICSLCFEGSRWDGVKLFVGLACGVSVFAHQKNVVFVGGFWSSFCMR